MERRGRLLAGRCAGLDLSRMSQERLVALFMRVRAASRAPPWLAPPPPCISAACLPAETAPEKARCAPHTRHLHGL